MAKLLLFVALLVTLAVAAESNTPSPAPAPAPATAPPAPAPAPHNYAVKDFSLKLILHNIAKRPVTFKLVKPLILKPVVCRANDWNSIKPFTPKYFDIEVAVIVETKAKKTVCKNLKINLKDHFRHNELKGKKWLVLTAVESWSWKSKYLLVTIGEVAVLSIKL